MANKALFNKRGNQRRVPRTTTVNEAGGRAYKFDDKHALAQYVVTGTFSNVYYASAKEQLQKVEALCRGCDSVFLAKLAVYGRQVARMKDTPAYLLAVLTARGELNLVSTIFDGVCDNSKMLLNYVQIIRSGAVGRRSLGSRPKKLVQGWIKSKTPKQLFLGSLGHANPSMADLIKMVRPRPDSVEEQTIYTYLTGLQRSGGIQADMSTLPYDLKLFEQLKTGESTEIPDIPFRALTNCKLSEDQWRQIGRNMPWNTLRMNLNMLDRNGAFRRQSFVDEVAAKLSDAELVRRFNVFPYQLMTTYQNVQNLPIQVKNALQDALEVATENVPSFDGHTVVAIDVSGSMQSSVTGDRRGSQSVTKCSDVAALIAACILRNNQEATVWAFDSGGWYSRRQTNLIPGLYASGLNPRDSVMTNARILANFGGGATDCSLPLRYINQQGMKVDNFIIVSDNQSWQGRWGHGDAYMAQWVELRKRCRKARMINLDVQPYQSTQSPDAKQEILNIGGFSDVVFTVMDQFFNRNDEQDFVAFIESNVDIA
jgi:60 kDa SS-A/Ro ribonucleoprotein